MEGNPGTANDLHLHLLFPAAPQTFSAPPQPQFYDSHAAASFNTPFGGAQGGLQVGQPSSLISTAITVVGGLMLFSFLMQVGTWWEAIQSVQLS